MNVQWKSKLIKDVKIYITTSHIGETPSFWNEQSKPIRSWQNFCLEENLPRKKVLLLSITKRKYYNTT